jgi:hypothetical protein
VFQEIGDWKMGLDQYATARRGEAITDDEGYTYYEDSMELAYWRKHPNLQGFMQELYYEKGDLDSLEATLDNEALPETEGFFFGSDSSEYYAEADREFIREARAAIKQGYTVVYSSWW